MSTVLLFVVGMIASAILSCRYAFKKGYREGREETEAEIKAEILNEMEEALKKNIPYTFCFDDTGVVAKLQDRFHIPPTLGSGFGFGG